MCRRYMNYYTSDELKWLKTNYSQIGSRACAAHLKRPLSSVRQTANKLGARVPKKLMNKLASESHIKNFTPTISPEIFKNVNTKESAYVLGMLWADGWVTSEKYYAINIKLVKEDFEEILPVFDELGPWKRYGYNPKGRKRTLQLVASGKELVDVFLKMGYNTKSHTSPSGVLSKIPSDLTEYWWRGYFDGDGHIKVATGYNRLELSSAWNQDWSFLPRNIPFKIYVVKGVHSYSKAILSSKKNILAFGSMIWNRRDGIGLTRKYNQFKKLTQSTK